MHLILPLTNPSPVGGSLLLQGEKCYSQVQSVFLHQLFPFILRSGSMGWIAVKLKFNIRNDLD